MLIELLLEIFERNNVVKLQRNALNKDGLNPANQIKKMIEKS